MIVLFAQVYLPIKEWCDQIEDGSWLWWARGCWIFDNETAATLAVGMTVAAVVGVQLWNASRTPKA